MNNQLSQSGPHSKSRVQPHGPSPLQKNFPRGCPILSTHNILFERSIKQNILIPPSSQGRGSVNCSVHLTCVITQSLTLHICHHASPDIQLASLELATTLPFFTVDMSLILLLLSPFSSHIYLNSLNMPPLLIHTLLSNPPPQPNV